MVISLPFLVGLVTLLAAPGPTNVLLAAAGAGAGPRKAWRLVPVGLGAYLGSIALLALTLGDAAAQRPALGVALQLAAAAYLALTAVQLWRKGGCAVPTATSLRMFATTALNPKALIFAFGFLPALGWRTGLALFVPLFLLCATGWLIAGNAIMAAAGRRGSERRIARATALANVLFATLIAGSLARAMI